MKRHLFIIAAVVLFCSSTCEKQSPDETPVDANPDSLAVVSAQWNWNVDSSGVTSGYATFPLFNKQASLSAAHYPAGNLSLSIAYHTGKDCMTTSAAGIDAGAVLAINGSYFDMKNLTAETFYASGDSLICANPCGGRTDGIVGIYDDGHSMDIQIADSTMYESYVKKYEEVLAAGPVLLIDGKIIPNGHNDFNDTSHPRSILGKDADGNIWMLVIDGRFPGQGEGASIEECSLICRYLGMTDAINLDGGGSSTLWTSEAGVINHPCDNRTWDHLGERKDPTVFVVR